MTASASEPHVGLIVEGPGDANSLPLLLRDWLASKGDYRDLLGKPAVCNGRDRAIVSNGIEGYIAAVTSRPECRSVLVVLDAEGDPACNVGPSLLARAQAITRLPVAVSLAERCWEDWLYASIETLRLGEGLNYIDPPHGTAAIKAALRPAKYVKPTWQPRLTARVDIALAASRSASLARMLQRFDELLAAIPS